MCKVSIIIPAYNIENYIERCLESCINQSFENIEIIVVDDGSKDNTKQIIRNYELKDLRIKVITTSNKGVNNARKEGLNNSIGDYILFLDGDDYLSKDAIEKCYNIAKDNDYDIIQFNYILKYSNGQQQLPWDNNFYNENAGQVFDDYKYLDLLFNTKCNFSIWSKFIRKEFMVKNNIELLSNSSYGEDLAFVYDLAMNKPKVYILNENLYYYYQREGSLSNKFSEKSLDINKSIDHIRCQLINNNLFFKYREEFNYLAYKHIYYIRKDYIYSGNVLSKQMFNNWKKLNIKINYKNNKYYSELYKNEKLKGKIICKIIEKNYTLGKIYYKLSNN